jgi:hypothetical protein
MGCVIYFFKKFLEPGVVVHACNLSTQEAEAEGSRVRGQPGLHSRPCVKKKKSYLSRVAKSANKNTSEVTQFKMSFKYTTNDVFV